MMCSHFAIGLLLVSAVAYGSPFKRQRTSCSMQAPCENIISRLGSSDSSCNTMKSYVKCLKDKFDDVDEYIRKCSQRRSVFDNRQSRLKEALDIYRDEAEQLCAMSSREANSASNCIARMDSSRCFFSASSRYGFSMRDLQTQTDRTPSIPELCRFIRDASRCLEDDIVSQCRQGGSHLRRLAQSVAEQMYKMPFDYQDNCKGDNNNDNNDNNGIDDGCDDDNDNDDTNTGRLFDTVLKFGA